MNKLKRTLMVPSVGNDYSIFHASAHTVNHHKIMRRDTGISYSVQLNNNLRLRAKLRNKFTNKGK